jgi:hypothetical protein
VKHLGEYSDCYVSQETDTEYNDEQKPPNLAAITLQCMENADSKLSSDTVSKEVETLLQEIIVYCCDFWAALVEAQLSHKRHSFLVRKISIV